MSDIAAVPSRKSVKQGERAAETGLKEKDAASGFCAGQIMHLQTTIGNQAVQKLVKSGLLQAKLTVSRPGDIYEQEADRVADQVMRMPDSILQTKPG